MSHPSVVRRRRRRKALSQLMLLVSPSLPLLPLTSSLLSYAPITSSQRENMLDYLNTMSAVKMQPVRNFYYFKFGSVVSKSRYSLALCIFSSCLFASGAHMLDRCSGTLDTCVAFDSVNQCLLMCAIIVSILVSSRIRSSYAPLGAAFQCTN